MSSPGGEMTAGSRQPAAARGVTPRVTRSMLLRCLLALSLLSGMALGEFFRMRSESQVFRTEATLINLAGRQRMLVQRAGLLVQELVTVSDPQRRESLRNELSAVAHQLLATHQTMVHGDPASGLPPADASMREVFFQPPHQLDDRLRTFSAAVEQSASLPFDALAADHPAVEGVRRGALGAELLQATEALVQRLQQTSQESFARLQATGVAILLLTLMVLAITGGLVFWPMIRAVQAGTHRLEMANLVLDRRAEELDRALSQLRLNRDEQRRRWRAMVSVMEDLEEERGKLQREIQARQIVQEALQESEQRIWSIVESSPIAMIMIGPMGKIVLVNAETEKLFNYSRQELLQQPVEMLVPQRFRKRHPQYRAGFFRNPVSRRMGAGGDLFGLRKDGSEFPIEIGLNPIAMDDGIYVLSAIVDITARKHAEREIQRINLELQRKNVELQQFVYTISHDLKSPLVTCKGFVGLLRDDVQHGRLEDVTDSIDRIERATDRMNALIEDLLQLSRIGTIRNEPERIDTDELVQAIATELESRLEAAGARLEIRPNLPEVVADRLRLGEVFENLLTNAIKYGCPGEDPLIEVGGEQREGEVRFFVRDNGPGIAPEFHERIFGLFQRLESDRDGTGVGLAAVSRIMEIHGGRVWVESAPGAGAAFWVAFPETARSHNDILGEAIAS